MLFKENNISITHTCPSLLSANKFHINSREFHLGFYYRLKMFEKLTMLSLNFKSKFFWEIFIANLMGMMRLNKSDMRKYF